MGTIAPNERLGLLECPLRHKAVPFLYTESTTGFELLETVTRSCGVPQSNDDGSSIAVPEAGVHWILLAMDSAGNYGEIIYRDPIPAVPLAASPVVVRSSTHSFANTIRPLDASRADRLQSSVLIHEIEPPAHVRMQIHREYVIDETHAYSIRVIALVLLTQAPDGMGATEA